MRILRDFAKSSIEEQSWIRRSTWCNQYDFADLGMVEPVEFEENGRTFVEGKCTNCAAIVTSEIESQNTQL